MAGTDDAYEVLLAQRVADPQRLVLLDESGMLALEVSIALDRLTRLACKLLDTPVSLISMVGRDQQFFKSAQGMETLMPEGRHTPLSHSFCQHVVASGRPFVVEDARQHPMVKDNFAIEELKVEAYLGIPLELPEGFVMGSLCAIDCKPRRWSAQDILILSELASSVMLDIGLQREIARRIAIEGELRESEARFNQVAENIEGLVFQRRKDDDGNFSYCFFGNSADSALPWRKISNDNPMPHRFGRVHPEDWSRLSAELMTCALEEADLKTEYRTITASGVIRYVRSQSKVRHAGDGSVIWDGAIFDVTDLVHARQAADAAMHSQRRMLSNINYDLRNPLTAMIGFGELLSGPPLPEVVARHADNIKRTGYLMLDMVDQMLDSASMESGMPALQAKRVSIARLVADSCRILEQAAALKGIDIAGHIAPDAPETINGDAVRLHEILVNLIGNAVKYTNQGKVRVTVSRLRADGVRFEVLDTGIGIPAEDIDRIFDRHHRVEDHRTAYAGTGFGLSIVRTLVEAMAGTLGVESDVGKGSLFWIELPLGDVPAPTADLP